jgi:hypothetical protein
MFAALNFQRPALLWGAYGVFVFLLCGVTSPMWIFRRHQLAWKWTSPSHVFAGQSLVVDGAWHGRGTAPYFKWGVACMGAFPYSIAAKSPGLLELPVFTGSTEYPVGLVSIEAKLPGHHDVWVYPTPVNHMETSGATQTKMGDEQILRQYQPGDRRNRILLKTQTLPIAQWVTRTHDHLADRSPSIALSWFDLPAAWTSQHKIEQLAYAVQAMPPQQSFKLTLPTNTTASGAGPAHQHFAWRQLATLWQSLNA